MASYCRAHPGFLLSKKPEPNPGENILKGSSNNILKTSFDVRDETSQAE